MRKSFGEKNHKNLLRKCHSEAIAIVECRHLHTGEATGQLVIDYMSDAILHVYPEIHGTPIATPDYKSVLNVEMTIGRLLIQQLNRTGETSALISTYSLIAPMIWI